MSEILNRKDYKIGRYLGRKHKFIFVECEVKEVNAGDRIWGGGSRSEYWFLNAETGKVESPDFSGLASSPFSGGALSKDIEIAPGWFLVQGGTFCGKPATITVFGRGSDLKKVAQ